LIKGAAVGGLASASLATPALSQGRTEWRMVTLWPRNLPGPGVAAQKVADRITAVSGGRITVRLFAAGEIVPAPGRLRRGRGRHGRPLPRRAGLLDLEVARHRLLRQLPLRHDRL
jgi:hypothetical protein